ncbi:MAG: sigma-54-dependent transcriptional regulator [Alphaproteobacteria bacterium]
MSRRKPSILLVEDTPPLARAYRAYLQGEPYDVEHVDTGKAALARLERDMPEAIVLDLQLPDMHGLEILKQVHGGANAPAVIVITANGSVNIAVEAMREGAVDFLVKPFTAERLIYTLRNALERQQLSRIVETYRSEIDRRSYAGFVGASLPMQAVYRIIDAASTSKATIFITGESGTGKEVCAEAIHQRSPRGEGPFVALNCAAIPKELMESEIFGHVKGAFTGAASDREGAAARADGGTLFLDEICEMPLDLQVKLLRFVQLGSFTKVGGTVTRQVDVRFICATNRDPLAEVSEGNFREDLYYRLHVIPIHMPPLRERERDVLDLAQHFLTSFAAEEGKAFRAFGAHAEALLLSYEWPGNVRQLQNVIRNIVVLNDGETVERGMLPDLLLRGAPQAVSVRQAAAAASPVAAQGVRPLAVVEREAIEAALAAVGGNIPRAAALLEVSPSTIYRKLARWEEQVA